MAKTLTIKLEPWMKTDEVSLIFRALDNNCRFVGGCVRDAILQKSVADIDIATSLAPDKVIEKLSKNGVKIVPTGLKHGTVTAIFKNSSYEITTLRNDEICDGRWAKISYTDSWQDDAKRRDFTINAMYADREGQIFDYFGGIDDLHAGKIIFVGDASKRCKEDILRILRFFRFYSYYGSGEFDKNAIIACKKFCSNIEDLSGERIRQEMLKLFAAPNPLFAISKMLDIGVLEKVFGLSSDNKIVPFPRLNQANIFNKLANLIIIENLLSMNYVDILKNPYIRIAIFLRSCKKGDDILSSIFTRWKLSSKEKKLLLFFAKHEPLPITTSQKIIKKVILEHGKDMLKKLLLISFALELEKDKKIQELSIEQNYQLNNPIVTDIKNSNLQIIDLSAKLASQLDFIDKWQIQKLPIDGDDILGLGIKSGKDIGKLLLIAKDLWQNSDYTLQKTEILSILRVRING